MRSTNPPHPALFLGSLAFLAAGWLSVPAQADAAPEAPPAPPPIASSAGAPAAAAPASSGDLGAPSGPKRALPPPQERANTCAVCHATLGDATLRSPAKECAGSAHRDDRLSCVGCHKGDPRDPTVGAHSKAAGFAPHPAEAEIAGICGGCHSDAGFMRRMNGRLHIGQEALFRLSVHGRLSGAGDPSAPNCAVCHGTHKILSPSSPVSPVNRLNVAKLCSGCHSDAARMSKYGARTDQFAKWEKSVHGQAFEKGNLRAPTCIGCHGAHSSAPPDSSTLAHVCGRCHETEATFFEQSAHSPAFRKRGIAQCVACHGNHDVAPASPMLVGTTPEASCMKCHEKDDRPRQVADAIATQLGGARERADAARAAVERARERGLSVAGATYALGQVSTSEQKLRGTVHTLDPNRLAAGVEEIDRAIAETKRLVAEAERQRNLELRDYYVALGLASLLLVSLLLKARQLERRRRTGAS